MNSVKTKGKKLLLISVGILAVVLGSIGVVLPLLPTTPLLLISNMYARFVLVLVLIGVTIHLAILKVMKE